MLQTVLISFGSSLVGGAFAAGAAWGVIQSELRALRRDVDRLERLVLRPKTTG